MSEPMEEADTTGEIAIRLPDIGEGIAEAEIAEWSVRLGQWIAEDDPIATVLTDKAAVEIPSSHAGKVTWLAGEAGDMLAVGAVLIRLDPAGKATHPAAQARTPEAGPKPNPSAQATMSSSGAAEPEPSQSKPPQASALAAAAVRARARTLGLELSAISGSGPQGRVTHGDLDRVLTQVRAPAPDSMGGTAGASARDGTHDAVTETRVIGLRRKIAEAVSQSHSEIPQITLIEEVDVTELERLRAQMNAAAPAEAAHLTLLPFIARGIARALAVAPQINGRYDAAAGVVQTHRALHLGVATQTDRGLVVPVIIHAEARDPWEFAGELARLTAAARDGSLARADLSGATLTLTSLGPLGALASTPLVHHPELAIVGINRKQIRPLWDGRRFQPREVMNLSASFDHRIIDGWEAAQFVARLKSLLETPARLFT